MVHAIVLLAHFHSLSSFVFSCGLTQELDTTSQSYVDIYNDLVGKEKIIKSNNIINGIHIESCVNNANNKKQPQLSSLTAVDALMEKMKVLSENCDECTETELSNRFKSVEMQAAELPSVTSDASTLEVPPKLCQYIDDASFTYQDFTRRGCENVPTTFRVQDYSWEDHGLSLVSQLYSDVGYLLDDKFRTAYNLTYYTIAGRQNVDTSKFRRAIWNYIQCIYGIRHDDYDYGEVNQVN